MARNEELLVTWLGCFRSFGEGEGRVEIGDCKLTDGTAIRAKVNAVLGDLIPRSCYRLFGHYRETPYGRQFQAKTFVAEQPIDEDSVIAYLMTCKSVARGSVSNRIAVLLFEKYGLQAIDKLIKEPAEAAEGIRQWTAAKAALASAYLRSQDHKRVARMQLIKVLDGRGFPRQTVDRAIRAWGVEAGALVTDDPYILMALPGIGFKSADKMFCDLAREKYSGEPELYRAAMADVKRQGLCLCFELTQDRSGSTWMRLPIAKAGVQKNLSEAQADPELALEWAKQQGRVWVRKDNYGSEWIAISSRAIHEAQVAEFVSQEMNHDLIWPSMNDVMQFCPDGMQLSEHQQQELSVAISGQMGCLQGGPGAGKTVALSCLVKAIIDQNGESSIAVATPTGKAAVRAQQALLANDVEMQVTTVHRLLKVMSASGGSWSFVHGEENPIPFRFLIVDESSMLDTSLMASLLRACASDTHILFVGDVNQLAPVGHGRPFEDIQQVIPTGRLTEIRRNSGQIVRSCASIRDEQRFMFSSSLDIENGDNLPLCSISDDERQAEHVDSLIAEITTLDPDVDPVWDIQVVTALNDRGLVSRKPLNLRLQGELNSGNRPVQGCPFRVSDKVVCLSNGSYLAVQEDIDTPKEHFVANGELGEVTEVTPTMMKIKLEEPYRLVRIPMRASSGDGDDAGSRSDWDLGYVLSCHRSQGSQWKYVIVMVDSNRSASGIQSRNWIYTAISRAEVATWIIGEAGECHRMMRRDGTSERKTFLVEQSQWQRLCRNVSSDVLFAPVG